MINDRINKTVIYYSRASHRTAWLGISLASWRLAVSPWLEWTNQDMKHVIDGAFHVPDTTLQLLRNLQ